MKKNLIFLKKFGLNITTIPFKNRFLKSFPKYIYTKRGI